MNRYVIRGDRFDRLYQPVQTTDGDQLICRAKGVVSAIRLPLGFDILAPWNEQQISSGGYAVLNGAEVYGVAEPAFAATYDVLGPAAYRLLTPGCKRMLSLDGGGVRGMITIAFLERLEQLVRAQHGNSSLVLADYFDMIGGTSVGSIIAVQLALGDDVATVKKVFEEWSPGTLRQA